MVVPGGFPSHTAFGILSTTTGLSYVFTWNEWSILMTPGSNPYFRISLLNNLN